MKKSYPVLFLFLLFSGILLAQVTDIKVTNQLTPQEKEILVNQKIPNMEPLQQNLFNTKGVVKWSQGFEDATFPPAGWAVHNLDAGAQSWVRYTSSPIFGSASASIRYESSTLNNNDWLVSPSFAVSTGDKLNFYAVGSSTYVDSLIIYVSTEGGVPPTNYVRIAGVRPMAAPAQFFSIPLGAYAGQTIYVAFNYKELDELRVYLDSVYVETPVPNDVAMFSTNASGEMNAGVPFTPTGVVKNLGTATNTFNVTMKINPGGYTSTKSVTSLAPDSAKTVTFDAWTPTTGNYDVKVYTQLAGDQNTSNDTLSRIILVTSYIYSNGPLVTGPGAGFGGADISELQTALNTYGWGSQASVGNFIADDFVIPGTEKWQIDGIQVFTYQTGSTTTSTINLMKAAIYQGHPMTGLTLVWGDTTTNIMAATEWTGIYRTITGTPLGNTRPIMKVNGTSNVLLDPGTYWLVYTLGGTLTSGPWAPPITIMGTFETGNGHQKTSGLTWAAVRDSAAGSTSGYAQGFAFKFAGSIIPVPVELTSFNATISKNIVSLNWATSTEVNNSGFDIERKLNSGNFESIGFVPGRGTTTVNSNYNFNDNLKSSGKYTYRLKQIDFDGKFEYSNEVEVNMNVPTEFSLQQNYPNPFNPSTIINFGLKSDSKVTLKIFNTLGQEVKTLLNDSYNAGVYNIELNASDLNSGVYFYRLEAAGVDGSKFSSSKKMILIK